MKLKMLDDHWKCSKCGFKIQDSTPDVIRYCFSYQCVGNRNRKPTMEPRIELYKDDLVLFLQTFG